MLKNVAVLTALIASVALAEEPYAFRARLETVHEPGLRDAALKAEADEFAFADGMKVDDADFADYLNVSMGVKASVGRDGAVVATIDDGLRDREYEIEVRKDGVEIRGADDRALHQAYYHLEDLMNLRRAPFLKLGKERRRMRFSPRMIHSGYGCDVFPDNYLKRIAHHGFDAIVFYIKDVDRTAAGPNQDVNGLIARARKVGLDTYLYSSVSCFAHPDDPEGSKAIEASFGRIAKAHPGAKGIVFVGESCQFPSKDPRVQPVRHRDKNHDDPRPLAGWFPCKDYPDWLRAVMDVLHRHSPNMEIVFWTYNWSRQDAKVCADLIPNFPDGVAIQGTLGNGAVTKHDNGLVCHCRDYTVSTPGFTDHYAAQAKAAKAGKRRFYTMANTAGLTWDYGVAPYLPCPFQWKKRWDGLKDPQYGVAGLMETHHFGWYPSFISELAKEAYTEGGMDFDEHIRKIAVRDFGEANAEKVVEAWRKWSRTEVDYVANNENQYGPFRIGPAFPYNFGGKKILHAEFPQSKTAYHTMRWMAILNFPFDLEQAREQNIAFVELDDDYRLKQLELFERMRTDWADGVKALREAARTLDGARRAKAEEMIGVGEWHQRSVETAINLNRGYLAFKRGDREGMLKYARAEYANAQAALKLVERDSRLGWEPSMEYAAGPEQIRWKLHRMEELYGSALVVQPVEPVLFEVDHPETFDPAKAGWTCVFEDEFEGTAVDTNKWYRPHFARTGRQKVEPDGNGHLVFHVRKNEKGVIPDTYLYSVPEYKYGYFEARVKFTDKAGWWAASWIHGGSKENPFLDGFEIDTFEDFFTRLPEDHPLHNRMAHSLHTKIGDYGASYQLHSTPPDLGAFHIIACKWDPLGMTFYLDGSRVGGYSAFNNATCIRPLHAILSAEGRGTQWLKGRTEPEEGTYEIDWVRIWQDPEATVDVPTVTLKATTDQAFVERGTNVEFTVEAVPSRSDDPVYAVYLFDNGYLIDRSVERPFAFTVPMTDEYFAFSHYGRFTGHTGPKRGTRHPELDTYPHVFVAFAKTRSGKIAQSEPVIRIPAPAPVPVAFEDRPQAIPGTVEPWRFDVGGQGRAYHKLLKKKLHQRAENPRPDEKLDCSKTWVGVTYAGEWINYTVDVAAAGRYAATASFASPLMSANDLALLVDGRPAGAFPLPAERYFTFSPSRQSTIEVDLPAGRHVLTVLFKSQIGFGGISFKAKN